jgi:2-methylcitrate dehydratase PrpD
MFEADERGLSEAIATHCVATSFEALPPIAAHAARRALLDALGVMLGATGLSAEARLYAETSAGLEPGRCRILGSDRRTGSAGAAFANGALAHVLDFGDCFDAGPAHPHAALVPALMAFADTRPDAALGEVLCALALGGDLACRLSIAASQPYEVRGWYPPPLVNLVSSAAACARFIGLDVDGIVAAMSFAMLSGSFPAALKDDRATPLRGTREAFAARGAVEAASLARTGAHGFADPLGGTGGFFEVFAGGCRADVLLDQLGERFLATEVSFKRWPACRGTHAYIEAAIALRERVDPREIRALTADVGPIQQMLTAVLPAWPEPIGVTAAKFSIPFTVSVAIIDGHVDLSSFDESHLNDKRVRQLAAKLDTRLVAEWGREHAASGRLAIGLADGTRHEVAVMDAQGSPSRPLSDEALVAKFVTCAGIASTPLSAARAEEFAEAILLGAPEISASSLLDRLGGAE